MSHKTQFARVGLTLGLAAAAGAVPVPAVNWFSEKKFVLVGSTLTAGIVVFFILIAWALLADALRVAERKNIGVLAEDNDGPNGIPLRPGDRYEALAYGVLESGHLVLVHDPDTQIQRWYHWYHNRELPSRWFRVTVLPRGGHGYVSLAA